MIQSASLRRLLVLLVTLSLLALSVACGGGDDEADEEDNSNGTETAATTPYKVTGNEGSLAGTINFTGAAPAAKPISMDADPACASSNPNAKAEDVVVNDGKLQNVFIYVKDGKTSDGKSITSFAFDPPAPDATLDQHGCQYHPHVLGMMTTENFKVTNSDQTTHNVHPSPKSNQEWNQSQTAGQAPIINKFPRPEIIPVKCNQHPWMKAYVAVQRTPFFAVSGADGKFEIKGLPPGTYTIAAWHEKYGEKTQTVTVAAKESKTQDFSYDGTGATSAETAHGSMPIADAIEFPMIMKHQ
ncbi:MAG: carboxypeptidase regulatory-like domain-containing protein [Acidobacteriota bacterium]|nr:carboxypeptidase regulatory-like domain-containing protein [Acidobacteriota bacterium]